MSEITSKDVQLYLSNIYGTKEFLKKQKFLEEISYSQEIPPGWQALFEDKNLAPRGGVEPPT